MRNVMAEEDKQKALSQLFFSYADLQKCRVRVGRTTSVLSYSTWYIRGDCLGTRDMGWESTLLIHNN